MLTGAVIAEVLPESIAEELELVPGDELLEINGQKLEDLIDYRFLCASEEVELLLRDAAGEEFLCQVEKDENEDLGLVFTESVFGGMRRCNNHCLFCFMEQLPPACRPSLSVKDDDYRMSFLSGNYITGNNLTEKDLARIERMRLSPLYISVHSTDPELRCRLMGNKKAGGILALLRRLSAAGIELHTQVVLCPGYNDGTALERTLCDLAGLWPGVASVALVPVGLTRYQKNALRPFDADSAAALLAQVGPMQESFREKMGSSFVFPADEFYLLAGQPFPAGAYYEGYPQLEDGIGIGRLFQDGCAELEAVLPERLSRPLSAAVLTGRIAEPVLRPFIERLNGIEGLSLTLIAPENRFFGGGVTVTGLLAGSCILAGLQAWRAEQKEKEPLLFLPTVLLRHGETVFLDDMTVEELAERLQLRIRLTEPDAASFWAAICQELSTEEE